MSTRKDMHKSGILQIASITTRNRSKTFISNCPRERVCNPIALRAEPQGKCNPPVIGAPQERGCKLCESAGGQKRLSQWHLKVSEKCIDRLVEFLILSMTHTPDDLGFSATASFSGKNGNKSRLFPEFPEIIKVVCL